MVFCIVPYHCTETIKPSFIKIICFRFTYFYSIGIIITVITVDEDKSKQIIFQNFLPCRQENNSNKHCYPILLQENIFCLTFLQNKRMIPWTLDKDWCFTVFNFVYILFHVLSMPDWPAWITLAAGCVVGGKDLIGLIITGGAQACTYHLPGSGRIDWYH